jgi:hypothetical protein
MSEPTASSLIDFNFGKNAFNGCLFYLDGLKSGLPHYKPILIGGDMNCLFHVRNETFGVHSRLYCWACLATIVLQPPNDGDVELSCRK